MSKRQKVEIKYDYYPLRGFIYGNRKLKNVSGFAKFLGMTRPNLTAKFESIGMFSQDDIYKTMVAFNLTPQQVIDFFFTKEKLENE